VTTAYGFWQPVTVTRKEHSMTGTTNLPTLTPDQRVALQAELEKRNPGVVFVTIGEDEMIPDGAHFISDRGAHCYKVPKSQFDEVCAFGLDESIVGIKSWPAEKIERAHAWTTQLLSEKGGKDNPVFMIFPVTKAKQARALGLYMSRLWNLRKGLEAVRAGRAAEAKFGKAPVVPVTAPVPAAAAVEAATA
jgi:hypothetical protein